MNKEMLYKVLDIDNGEDFQYFENFADLVEYDGSLDGDVILELVNDINMKTFAELCESYFYEVEENIPDAQIDLYNLIENIKRSIIGLSQAVGTEDENAAIKLADQINDFRIWYSIETNSECKNLATQEIENTSVRDAIVQSRLEKMGNQTYQYDFTVALDYKLDEYIMTYADMVVEE